MVSTRHVWRTGGTLAVAAAVAFVLFAVAGSTATTTAAGAAPAASAATQPAGADAYAGDDTCLTCHEKQSVKGTAHGRSYKEDSPASQQGCESCHGPGKEHAEAGGDVSKITTGYDMAHGLGRAKAVAGRAIVNPKDQGPGRSSEGCTTCHNRKDHALWVGSQHDQRQVGCLSCHSVHEPVAPKLLKAKDEMALCGTCHRPIANKQYRFNHMPLREGKMSCSSCHNVHGSVNVKLLKTGTTIDESCTSCHAEKRGPFIWDHAPVSESCTTCHDPHGSNNDRMLVAKQPFLCQRCHVTSRHPPTVYEGYLLQNSQNANKIYSRSCVVCHQQVHGSNSPSGKAFLR